MTEAPTELLVDANEVSARLEFGSEYLELP